MTKTYLFFDTETTGLPRSKPHIVQLAALLTDAQGGILMSIDTMCKPTDWVIPDEAAKIHGITTQKAARYGIAESSAAMVFRHMASKADLVIAHNVKFDLQIMRIAYERFNMEWRELKTYCTMEATRNVLKIPPTERMLARGYDEYKSPKLSEAYLHYTGKELTGAHDAMIDVQACAEIYRHLSAH